MIVPLSSGKCYSCRKSDVKMIKRVMGDGDMVVKLLKDMSMVLEVNDKIRMHLSYNQKLHSPQSFYCVFRNDDYMKLICLFNDYTVNEYTIFPNSKKVEVRLMWKPNQQRYFTQNGDDRIKPVCRLGRVVGYILRQQSQLLVFKTCFNLVKTM